MRRTEAQRRNIGAAGPFKAGMKTFITALAALALLPPAAGAATITATTSEWSGKDRHWRVFAVTLADDGGSTAAERNEIEVRIAADGSVSARDLSVPLVAASGCAAGGGGWVTCAAVSGFTLDFDVALGPGDDVFRVAPGQQAGPFADLSVDGGDGNDRISGAGVSRAFLVGGRGNDLLIGSDGDDLLAGGVDEDDLRGGAGDDTLLGDDGSSSAGGFPGGAFADRLDGGPGRDLVTYASFFNPVSVDLSAGTATTADAAGTPVTDRLIAIESVRGTASADVLLGSDGDDELDGGAGADVIDGRGGDDVLKGEQPASVRCGDGADVLPATRPVTSLPFPGRDCERIVSPVTTYSGLVLGRRSLRLVARVGNTTRTRVCAVRATVVRQADRAKAIARTTVRIPDRRRRTLTLHSRRTWPTDAVVELRPQRCRGRRTFDGRQPAVELRLRR